MNNRTKLTFVALVTVFTFILQIVFIDGCDPSDGATLGHHHDVQRINLREEDANRPVVAAIISILAGSSYDPLFREVPQVTPKGRVSVFSIGPSVFPEIIARWKNPQAKSPQNGRKTLLDEMIEEIDSLSPESVVFNWECCSAWGGETFGEYRESTMELIHLAISRRHMVMAADFALKALITDWDEKRLGPNPFVKMGSFSYSFDLKFDPALLKECDSVQLQRVGELSANGEATLEALAGTIAFAVNKDVETPLYKVEVLTVASRMRGLDMSQLPENRISKIGNRQGLAGHVMLHYDSGGKMLVSAGHWIELTRLDVSKERLIEVARSLYGAELADEIVENLGQAKSQQEEEAVKLIYSSKMVYESAPGKYSETKESNKNKKEL